MVTDREREALRDIIEDLHGEAERQEMRGNYDAGASFLSFKSELQILVEEGVDEFRDCRGEYDE